MKAYWSLLMLIFLCISCDREIHKYDQYAMFRGSAQLTGIYPEPPVRSLTGVKFTFQTQGPIRSTPVSNSSSLFFGSADGYLYSIDKKSGELIWKFKTEGAIHSSPALVGNEVFFSNRYGKIYSVDATTGKEVWSFSIGKDVAYPNGWDYFLSSPIFHGELLYIGSGDGHVYAFSRQTKELVWKHNFKARIRTTVAIEGDLIFVGTMDGYIYAINKNDGSENWKFATRGVNNKFADYDFDATAILSSPSVSNGILMVGARDGFLYAIDTKTGKELWNVDHEGSWVLGTAIKDNVVFAVSGSSRFIQALDIKSGKELWRTNVKNAVFSSITVTDDVLYMDDYFGDVYAMNTSSGEILWKFPMGRRSLSTPYVSDNIVYCSSDDGILFALDGSSNQSEVKPVSKKMVFWEQPKSTTAFRWFINGVDLYIRDYFISMGYTLVDAKQLEANMKELVASPTPSVVVFALNECPTNVIREKSEQALIRKYLNAGGKVVFLGPDPLAVYFNDKTGEADSVNFQGLPKSIMGLQYTDAGSINIDEVLFSDITLEGVRWGLRNWWAGYNAIDSIQVTTVLAKNEYNRPSAWVKNFGGKQGTGLMMMGLPRNVTVDLQSIRTAIEYGIDW